MGKMTTLRLIPEEKCKNITKTSKSMESLYSSSSSKMSTLMNRKRTTGCRQSSVAPAMSDIRQRVLSARVLRTKHLQNQLSDAQQQIVDLNNENRILRTLHKRQDSALSKYENTNADLPQLLHSHAEEIRAWQTKYKNLQIQNRELNNKLKQKDAIILQISDQNRHLHQLNRNKNLEEREKLAEKVKELEQQILDKDNDAKLLARRLQIETKNFKSQLTMEQQKLKDTFNKLDKAKHELSNIKELGDTVEKPTSLNLLRATVPTHKMKTLKINSGHVNTSKTSNISLSSNSTPSLTLQMFPEKINEPPKSDNLQVDGVKSYRHTKLQFSDPKSDSRDSSPEKLITTRLSTNKSKLTSVIKNGINKIKEANIEYVSTEVFVECDDKDLSESDTNDGNDICTNNNDENNDIMPINNRHGKIEYNNLRRRSSLNTESTQKTSSNDFKTKHADFNEINIKHQTLKDDEDNDKDEDNSDSNDDNDLIVNDIDKIKNDYQVDLIEKEGILDQFCESTTIECFSDPVTVYQPNQHVSNLPRYKPSSSTKYENADQKRSKIDPKKKVKLLAALKAIDANEICEI